MLQKVVYQGSVSNPYRDCFVIWPNALVPAHVKEKLDAKLIESNLHYYCVKDDDFEQVVVVYPAGSFVVLAERIHATIDVYSDRQLDVALNLFQCHRLCTHAVFGGSSIDQQIQWCITEVAGYDQYVDQVRSYQRRWENLKAFW